MAKPATFNWATNANYATGPAAGTPTKVAPGGGDVADGFIPTSAAVPQHVNYLLDALGDWTTYLDNLPFEPQFLNNVFNFGTHVNVAGNLDVNGQTTLDGNNFLNNLQVTNGAQFDSGLSSSGPVLVTGGVTASGALIGSSVSTAGTVTATSDIITSSGSFKFPVVRPESAYSLPNFRMTRDAIPAPVVVQGISTDVNASQSLWYDAVTTNCFTWPLIVPANVTITGATLFGYAPSGTSDLLFTLRMFNCMTGASAALGTSAFFSSAIPGSLVLPVTTPTLIQNHQILYVNVSTGLTGATEANRSVVQGISISYTTNKPTDQTLVP